MTVDPVPAAIAGFAVAWLFAHAAWHKLRGFGEFVAILGSYRLLPLPLLRPAAGLLVLGELAVAAGATAGAAPAFVGAALLLALYAGAIAANLVRDRALLDCGCGGPPQPITWWLVLRNAALIALSGFALLPTTARALGPLDLLTIGAAVLFLGGLYATLNSLHAAHTQLEEWV